MTTASRQITLNRIILICISFMFGNYVIDIHEQDNESVQKITELSKYIDINPCDVQVEKSKREENVTDSNNSSSLSKKGFWEILPKDEVKQRQSREDYDNKTKMEYFKK